MDVEASIVEIAEDCEEKFIKIIHLELYSNCEEIRICNIRTRKEYRQSGHTSKRLVRGVMLDLSPYFVTVSVSSHQLHYYGNKTFFKGLKFSSDFHWKTNGEKET